MKWTKWASILLVLVSIAVAEEKTPRPLPAEQAAKEMKLPEGFQAQVFAAEPDVVQPISFCFDDRGRAWVVEATNYGEWKATGKDRVVILEDTDGDGKADKRTLFYEGFNYATGIEYGFGGIYVISPPNLYFVPDRNGDDKPDGPPEVLFDGFGYKESRHNLANGFTWGPDGWLYAGHGRTSPSDVGRPGTPANKRIHCDGGVYRIHPTRLVFENFADGTTNPWGVDFDDYGQCFVSNCVNPHLFHMIQGGHYEPWRNRSSSQYAYERLPTIADHLHYPGGDLRSTLGTPDTLAMGGGHAHCGTLIYLGGQFPADFRNNVLMCNIHGHRINRDILKRSGSGYVASHGKDFAISTDPWFMGVTLRGGPDGSVYVSDWSDTGECHTYKPNTATGRIYKISYGKPDKVKVDLAKKTDLELVKLQLDRNEWSVRHARRLLQERAEKAEHFWLGVHEPLREMLSSNRNSVAQRLRALWTLHGIGGLDWFEISRLLGDPDEHVRAWAVQIMCEKSIAKTDKLEELAAHDSSPMVRLYLAAALQRLPKDAAWRIAEKLLVRDDAKDPNLPLMYWYGIEALVASNPVRGMLLVPNCKIPLVRRFISRRIVEGKIAQQAKGNYDYWVDVLSDCDDSIQLDVLQGVRDATKGAKSMTMPKVWPEVYSKLCESKNADIREHATLIGLVFDDPQALAHLQKIATDTKASANERMSALDALIDKRIVNLAALLHALLDDKSLRRTAIRGLATIADSETSKLLLARYAGFTPEERRDAIATLAARKESAVALLESMERKVVAPGDVSAFVARQIHALGDKGISDRLRAVWGEIRDTPADKQKLLAKYKAQLTPNALKAANLSNGRLLFSKNCQQCHKLFGEGTTIGPDLTGSNRENLDYLLSNLVDPSAEVGRDFRMSVVTTKNERILTGIVVEKTPTRVVIQTATEKVTLAGEDIESLKDSAVSIMPDGQLDSLSKEQVRDLIAYIGSNVQVAMPAEKPK
jgi:putative membrane-bound dehydrogenase-like protein